MSVSDCPTSGNTSMANKGKAQVMANFGQPENYTVANLRALRDSSGMSRRALIERLKQLGIEMHANSLRRIEDGDQPMRVQEAQAFAEIFNVTLEDFVAKPIDPAGRLGFVKDVVERDMFTLSSQARTFISARNKMIEVLESGNFPPPEQSAAVNALLEFFRDSQEPARAALQLVDVVVEKFGYDDIYDLENLRGMVEREHGSR